ncbi:MAG: hypothetical protein ACRC2O_08775 [Chitinophagaceae bacterium]
MNEGLVHLHNFLRWVILVLLVISIVKSYSGWKGKKVFSAADARVWLFTMIAAHITLLLGLYQWLAGRYGMITSELPAGTSMMKDKFYRFFWMEHPLTMILAIVMITLGRGLAKKALPDEVKYRKAFWFFFIALVLILIGMPWPFRELIGRPWFPGMG